MEVTECWLGVVSVVERWGHDMLHGATGEISGMVNQSGCEGKAEYRPLVEGSKKKAI